MKLLSGQNKGGRCTLEYLLTKISTKHMNCRYEAVDQQVAGVNERMNPCVQTQERRNQTKQKNLCGVRRRIEKDGPPAARRTNLNSAYQNLTNRTPQDTRPQVRHNVLITQTGPVHSVIIKVPYESGCFGLKAADFETIVVHGVLQQPNLTSRTT